MIHFLRCSYLMHHTGQRQINGASSLCSYYKERQGEKGGADYQVSYKQWSMEGCTERWYIFMKLMQPESTSKSSCAHWEEAQCSVQKAQLRSELQVEVNCHQWGKPFIIWRGAFIHWETLSEHLYINTFIHLYIYTFRAFIHWETHSEQIIGLGWPA